jgi:undecaprenyl phosphate-alpha-L-ara4N flippase subunit ArnE
MNFLQIILVLATVGLLSIGQVLFKLAAIEIVNLDKGIFVGIVNQKLIIALVVYALATGMWVLALMRTPLYLAYPFVAMAFIIVPVLSHWLIGEPLKLNTFIGALIILFGVWISTISN